MRRRLRNDQAATDPILVIAAIAVSLVLLVGGSFTVSAALANAKNLIAKQDLDRIATAQAARVANGADFADSITDLTAGSNLSITAGVGSANVGVHAGSNCWTAFTRAATGTIWTRTSTAAAARAVATPWPSAAPSGWPAGCAWPGTVDDAIPVVIVNELPNPVLTTGSTGWSGHLNDGPSLVAGRIAASNPWGGYVYRTIANGSGYGPLVGPYFSGRLSTGQFALEPGERYTFSVWMKTNATTPMVVTPRIEWYAAGDNIRKASRSLGSPVTLEPGVWTRISGSDTVPAEAPVPTATFYSEHTWAPGETLDAIAGMITRGDTAYDYADGSSTGWSWTGTANLSPSTGLGRTTGRIPGS